jgi:hypothetical protein
MVYNKSIGGFMLNEKVVLKNAVTSPYLIQRCKIKDRSNKTKIVSEALSFDYMGSSEFEWGALPRNTEALYLKRDKMVITDYTGVLPKNVKSLFILSLPEQAVKYQTELLNLIQGKTRTKEYVFSSFSDEETTEVWLDLDNQVVFSSNKNILARLSTLLEGSMVKIKENQRVKAKGDQLIRSRLSNFYKSLPGTVAICPTSINDSEGAKALIGSTTEDVVFWLNGPYVNNNWVCGYFTVEALEQFAKSQSGPVADVVETCSKKK